MKYARERQYFTSLYIRSLFLNYKTNKLTKYPPLLNSIHTHTQLLYYRAYVTKFVRVYFYRQMNKRFVLLTVSLSLRLSFRPINFSLQINNMLIISYSLELSSLFHLHSLSLINILSLNTLSLSLSFSKHTPKYTLVVLLLQLFFEDGQLDTLALR